MKLKINHIQFIVPAANYKGTVIRSVNPKNRDTMGWTMELTDDGVLCTERDGRLLLVPMSNVAVMRVEEVESKPVLSMKGKSTLKKAK